MESPPKRPLTSFIRFSSDPRVNDMLRKNYPGLSG